MRTASWPECQDNANSVQIICQNSDYSLNSPDCWSGLYVDNQFPQFSVYIFIFWTTTPSIDVREHETSRPYGVIQLKGQTSVCLSWCNNGDSLENLSRIRTLPGIFRFLRSWCPVNLLHFITHASFWRMRTNLEDLILKI